MKLLDHLTDDPAWVEELGRAHGDLAFDIGANIGQYAHFLSSRFNKVVSFEPCAESYAVLYAHHPKNVMTIPEAVGDHVGTMLLAESSRSIDSGQLTSGEEDALDWGETLGWRTVACTTIDQECLHWGFPDAVKIDTEGCELTVLAGAPRLIDRHSATWYIEIHGTRFEEPIRDVLDGYTIEVEHGRHAPPGWENYYLKATP